MQPTTWVNWPALTSHGNVVSVNRYHAPHISVSTSNVCIEWSCTKQNPTLPSTLNPADRGALFDQCTVNTFRSYQLNANLFSIFGNLDARGRCVAVLIAHTKWPLSVMQGQIKGFFHQIHPDEEKFSINRVCMLLTVVQLSTSGTAAEICYISVICLN